MAACQAAKDAVWLRAFLTGLGLAAVAPTTIFCDSQGAIAQAKNPEHHQRSKHIDMRYHLVREQVAGGAIALMLASPEEVADLSRGRLRWMMCPRHRRGVYIL